MLKFHCFGTHFTLISCSSENTKGREERGKSIHFLKALFKTNSQTDVSRSWLWPYFGTKDKIFGTKDYYFTTHATKRVLTENECFPLS